VEQPLVVEDEHEMQFGPAVAPDPIGQKPLPRAEQMSHCPEAYERNKAKINAKNRIIWHDTKQLVSHTKANTHTI